MLNMSRTHALAVVATAVLIGGCAGGSEQAGDVDDNDGDPGTTSSSVPESSVPGSSMSDTTPEITLELAPTTSKVVSTVAASESGTTEGFDEALFTDIETGLAPFIERATADLAQRLAVADTAITTASATLVTWADSSMGCPLPDMQYAQALQDGSLIELEYASTIYRYHSGGERVPFLCNPGLAVPPVNGSTADS